MRADSKKKIGPPRDWATVTAAGFRDLASARLGKARRRWLLAHDTLSAAIPGSAAVRGDPRVAASHSNIGAGFLLLGRTDQAKASLDAAELAWLETIGALATLDFPVVGRSSAFHFKLASRNVSAFQETRRKRYAELCDAALAVTRFNRLVADTAAPARHRMEQAARALAALLSNRFGPRAPDVVLLTGFLAAAPSTTDGGLSPYADKASEFETRRQSLFALLPEACGNLEAATALTALVVPGLGRPCFNAIPRALPSPFNTSFRFEP
jgi:hypothetical protein